MTSVIAPYIRRMQMALREADDSDRGDRRRRRPQEGIRAMAPVIGGRSQLRVMYGINAGLEPAAAVWYRMYSPIV